MMLSLYLIFPNQTLHICQGWSTEVNSGLDERLLLNNVFMQCTQHRFKVQRILEIS